MEVTSKPQLDRKMNAIVIDRKKELQPNSLRSWVNLIGVCGGSLFI